MISTRFQKIADELGEMLLEMDPFSASGSRTPQQGGKTSNLQQLGGDKTLNVPQVT